MQYLPHWEGEAASLRPTQKWLANPAELGLMIYNDRVVFHSVRLRMLSGHASALAAAALTDTLESLRGQTTFGTAGSDTRSYRSTARGDLGRNRFVAEVTVAVKGGQGSGCAFFGLGKGVADPGLYDEPAIAPAFYLRLEPTDFGGKAAVFADRSKLSEGSTKVGDGTHRIRFAWDPARNRALFEISKDWDGKHFRADCTVNVDVPPTAFGDEGRVFIGGANGITFSDFSLRAAAAAPAAPK